MAIVRAFRALRPPPDKAAAVAAVPYDVVSTEEARTLVADNRLSFLHVSRAEMDLPDDTDSYADAVYEKARENFERLKHDCPLSIEEQPSLYVYSLTMGTHTQTGIAACCSVDDYDNDVIKKHERTRKDKEDDRTRHIVTLKAQTGPVFLAYRGRSAIDDVIAEIKSDTPLYDVAAPDGVRHTIWRAGEDATAALSEEFTEVPFIYIADGHHRAASASRARAALRDQNPGHTGTEEYNYFLAVLFPAAQLQILPYNRLVKDLNGLTPAEFLNLLSSRFSVGEASTPSPKASGEICVYLEGRWHMLIVPPESIATGDPIASLDVSILQDRVLDPILEIKDVRTDKRIDFVGGIRGTAALERAVDDGRAAVAFSLYPVTVDQLIAVSDANQIMPPKSTWFEPKLRDGFLIHTI